MQLRSRKDVAIVCPRYTIGRSVIVLFSIPLDHVISSPSMYFYRWSINPQNISPQTCGLSFRLARNGIRSHIRTMMMKRERERNAFETLFYLTIIYTHAKATFWWLKKSREKEQEDLNSSYFKWVYRNKEWQIFVCNELLCSVSWYHSTKYRVNDDRHYEEQALTCMERA